MPAERQFCRSNRRRSLTIVDTLTQADTGDLADKSLADALSRVSGVSTMQVLYGERQSFVVRNRTPHGAEVVLRLPFETGGAPRE